MSHANALLAPQGRMKIARLVVDDGWPVRRVAERFQCSPATVSKWAGRYRQGESLTDRSSRPHHSPSRMSLRVERRIIALRFTRRWGPHRISYHLGVPRSTVGRVLARYRMPLLTHVDRMTGLPVRGPKPVRYVMDNPGDLVHVDIKKLGRIPDGGGHRVRGRKIGSRNKQKQPAGYAFLHHAVDDCTRLVYSEQLSNERKDTAAGFWRRAHAFFASHGITVKAVMTDNGPCYRSQVFAAALGNQVIHKRTRPYRPQTNGKVERFNRTLVDEWAYAHVYSSDQDRLDTYTDWLHYYNHHRPHTGLGGQTPGQTVHNLTGNNT